MEKMTFWGYRRPDGRVGIRNKILILPASVCASDTTRIIASQVESAVTFNNQNGCSQVPFHYPGKRRNDFYSRKSCPCSKRDGTGSFSTAERRI